MLLQSNSRSIKWALSAWYVYMGWFKNDGPAMLLLRSDTPSTLIPTSNDYDLVVATSAYEQMKQCVRQ